MKPAMHRGLLPAFLACLLAVVAVAAALPAGAQSASDTSGVTVESLKGRLADAQARQDLAPELKSQIVETYQNAIAAVESAVSLRAETEESKKAQAQAPDTIQRLERELRSMRAESTSQAGLGDLNSQSLDALERLENRLRTEVDQSRARVADLQRRLDEIIARPLAARLEQAELREAIASQPI